MSGCFSLNIWHHSIHEQIFFRFSWITLCFYFIIQAILLETAFLSISLCCSLLMTHFRVLFPPFLYISPTHPRLSNQLNKLVIFPFLSSPPRPLFKMTSPPHMCLTHTRAEGHCHTVQTVSLKASSNLINDSGKEADIRRPWAVWFSRSYIKTSDCYITFPHWATHWHCFTLKTFYYNVLLELVSFIRRGPEKCHFVGDMGK